MKRVLFICIAGILMISLSCTALAQTDNRYLYITSNNDGDFYIDKIALDDAISLNSSPLDVWVKVVGSEMFMRNLVQQYPKLSYYSGWYMLQRIQFNISQYKLLSYFIYSGSGELVISYQYPDPEWQDTTPVSVPGMILHNIMVQLNKSNNDKGENDKLK
jgi:hypothetical protein